MKTSIFSIIFSFLLMPLFAQNNSSAKSLLDMIAKNYKTKNSFYMKFSSQLNNSKTNTKDEFNGEVYVKGDKFNLNVPKMDIQQIYDGNKLYTISKDQEEVTITKPQNNDELFTPTRIFEMYKSGYNISLDKKSKLNNKNIQYVKLTPVNNNKMKSILIGIDTQNNQLVQLIETNSNDTTTTITVEKELDNVIVPKGLISFNKKNFNGFYISEI